MNLTDKLTLLRQIGREIAALSEESKRLRAEAFRDAELQGFAVPANEDMPECRMLFDNTVVTLIASGKEHTVLFDDLEQVR